MRKDVFIETVFIKVNGGSLNPESKVKRVDIKAYLPACINYAMTEGYFLQSRETVLEKRNIPTQFYTFFNKLPLLVDEERKNRRYFELPATMVALPSNRGLRMVLDNFDNPYTPIADYQLSNLDYWLDILCDERFYRLEGKKIYTYNEPEMAEEMNVNILVSVDDLTDDAELPIPAGLENQALQMCFEFVTGIRQIDADTKIDATDIN